MFNDITDNTSAKVQGKCLESAKEVASSYADRSRVGYWCFCDSGSGQTWKYNEPRPPAQFVNGEWGKLASVMRRDFITSKHSAFKCSNMLQTRILTSKKVKPGMTEQNKPQNNLMFVTMVLACNQFCLFFAVKTCIQHKMLGLLLVTHNHFHQENIRDSSPQTTSLFSGRSFLHHEQSICAVSELHMMTPQQRQAQFWNQWNCSKYS